jgi:hypothetical protein
MPDAGVCRLNPGLRRVTQVKDDCNAMTVIADMDPPMPLPDLDLLEIRCIAKKSPCPAGGRSAWADALEGPGDCDQARHPSI